MTNRQFKVCKIIYKYKKLPIILKKGKISDYLELQEVINYHYLDFSDDNMDKNTEVYLLDELIEELENRRRRNLDVWFTRFLAIAALIISVIALLSQLGILGLPQYLQPL